MTSMIMSFTRNDAAAKALDGGTHITQTGAYTGQITQASMGMSDGGAQYLDIAFKADDGRLCFSRLFQKLRIRPFSKGKALRSTGGHRLP